MRYRWMFYLTGLPGWMRFGFSPGWIGRSPTGLGPAAQYLMYGIWPTPQMNYWWQMMGGVNPTGTPYASPFTPPTEDINTLKAQAEILEDQLEEIKRRIEELEEKK